MEIKEPGCQAWRVNSCVSWTKTTSVCYWFIGSFPSSKFPWVPNWDIPSYLCQRDPDKWMGWSRDWDQWRDPFLGLDRSRGRELVKNRDICRKILVGCEFYEFWVDYETLSFFLDYYPQLNGDFLLRYGKSTLWLGGMFIQSIWLHNSCLNISVLSYCCVIYMCYCFAWTLCKWEWFICCCNEMFRCISCCRFFYFMVVHSS